MALKYALVICFFLAQVNAFSGPAMPHLRAVRGLASTGFVSTRSKAFSLLSMTASKDSTTLEPVAALKLLMSTRSKEADKEALVSQMASLRQSGETEKLEALLNGMLVEVEKDVPSWASASLPLPLPSYRYKIATMKRMLDALLDGEVEPRRKRSAVFQLARQLPKSKGIWGLEREVIRRNSKAFTMEEMLERTPQDLETPKYEVLDNSKGWQVRKYDQFSVVSARMESSFGPGTFNALAGYIFGGNKEGVKMAMTTPVINRGGKKMSFIMPSAFWEDTSSCPTPATSDVQVEKDGGGLIEKSSTLAVMWFGGYATQAEVEQRKRALKQLVQATDKWELLDEAEDPCLLQYNDPFQPPWKRRNEVVVAVKAKAKA